MLQTIDEFDLHEQASSILLHLVPSQLLNLSLILFDLFLNQQDLFNIRETVDDIPEVLDLVQPHIVG